MDNETYGIAVGDIVAPGGSWLETTGTVIDISVESDPVLIQVVDADGYTEWTMAQWAVKVA